MKIASRVVPAAAAILAAATAFAGEVIGNTYISEKDGTFEITAEGWNIKDAETPGQVKIVELTTKQPINGITPSLQFYRLAHMGGAITPEFMLQQLREGLAKQGMEVGAIESRRFAGEPGAARIGEGFAGLTRSFMYAGARSLVVSHWPVSSQATVELMTAFFQELAAGRSKPEALALARRRLRSLTQDGVQLAHPYFWAPFVLVGEPR
jgi:hypothetical protein